MDTPVSFEYFFYCNNRNIVIAAESTSLINLFYQRALNFR